MNQTEINHCREIFDSFDTENTGTIDMWRLREILSAIGLEPTDEELFTMVSNADINHDGQMSFQELLSVIQNQRSNGAGTDDDVDTLYAWQALGGCYDKSGKIAIARIKEFVVRYDLKINIDAIIRAQMERKLSASLTANQRKVVIPDELDYDEFKGLLSEQRPDIH